MPKLDSTTDAEYVPLLVNVTAQFISWVCYTCITTFCLLIS